jgi:HPt (histidine-containing phosphotransfer) domain-containing protein
MTAHALVAERQRCLEAGMNDHVSKPIDPDALFATLMRWVKPRQVRAAENEPRSVNAADDVILPVLDGVDVAGALKRLAGNRRLYRDLLVQFAAKTGDANTQISAAIASGDRKHAERIVHTVKGVAGNIGLEQVFIAAESLERAIREKDAAVPALVEEFAQILGRQLQAIRQAMLDVMLPRPAAERTSQAFDARAASAAIGHLRTLLESGDCEATKEFHTLENTLTDIVDKPRLEVLSAAVREFDFEKALLKLDEIAEKYGANWEQEK